ncbi:hypothetical protein [Methylobacter sp. S3L5C]|uniref:hypothetical protein n=1 Tax=Methylobacter sp. S3L5C TaxID=2839024 RepID=UPI001FACB73F|nr:hypothetical protein [Methylobacter sp. S3L5C]UOA09097.1 hypothetical protein KKZ03_01880 [Methylobacter sp. S3L5C]
MTINPYFTDPQPPLITIQEYIAAYSAALVKAKDGSKQDTANKNACRLTLETSLFTLGNYVNLLAEHDVVKLDSSGFPLSKLPEPIGILDAPNLTVYYGNNPGEIIIEISVVPKASGYIVLYSPLPAPAENAEWYEKLFSSTKGTLTNLKSETKYIFKAAAISSEANTATANIKNKVRGLNMPRFLAPSAKERVLVGV